MAKPEYEFFQASNVEWTPCEGKVPTLFERILAKDPVSKSATRMLKFEPGTDTSPNGAQVHDFWEEVYILDGSIHDVQLNQTFEKGSYACRPPGMPHGPWLSPSGCVTFEVRYYSSSDSESK